MIKLTAIAPKGRTLEERARAAMRALDTTAQETRSQLGMVVSDWEHHVRFEVSGSGPEERVIATDDAIFAYQNDGTKPHPIMPRRARVLRFQAGGATVWARRVRHPGTKAQQWTITIAARMQRRLAQRIQQELR